MLFGNLIDNAIEAAEKSKDKKIVLEISEKGEYLSIILLEQDRLREAK